MIAVELAMSVVLLVGAGLLSRSLGKLTAVDPGFRVDNLLSIQVTVPRSAFADTIARQSFDRDMVARLQALPGVVAVTATDGVPFSGSYSSSGYLLANEQEARARTGANRHEASQRSVSPNFFSMMGIPVLSGRAFTNDDRSGAPRVAIISESAARRDWPNTSPIGEVITYQNARWTIVGIVADIKAKNLSGANEPSIYTPLAQRPYAEAFLLRAHDHPSALVPAVRSVLRALAPTAVLTRADVMGDMIRQSFSEERFRTMLITMFAAIAAVLASVGMFGVTSRAVSRRTREVGIRVALGATAGSVVRMIVGHTLTGVAVGVFAGMAVSVVASRVLSPYLFGVNAHDPVTYGGILAMLALVCVVASWIPARRAGRLAPAAVLRGDGS